jgi:hypothetical protein
LGGRGEDGSEYDSEEGVDADGDEYMMDENEGSMRGQNEMGKMIMGKGMNDQMEMWKGFGKNPNGIQ